MINRQVIVLLAGRVTSENLYPELAERCRFLNSDRPKEQAASLLPTQRSSRKLLNAAFQKGLREERKKRALVLVARAHGCGSCDCSCSHKLLREEISDEFRQPIARKVKTGVRTHVWRRQASQPIAFWPKEDETKVAATAAHVSNISRYLTD